MGFWLKKTIGFWMMPLSTSILLIAVGLMLLWFTRFQKTGRVFVGAALFWLVFCSLSVTSNAMLRPLERMYPEYAGQPVDYVVVLGTSMSIDPDIPLRSRLSPSASARLAEGLRIARLNPEARLIVTGEGGFPSITYAQIYKEVAIADGFDGDKIITVDHALDTEDEARDVRALLNSHQQQTGQSPTLALVTEASHMPRAVSLFRSQGLDPIPAPTFFRGVLSTWRYAYLDVDNLQKSERAIYEYLGRVFYYIKVNAEKQD